MNPISLHMSEHGACDRRGHWMLLNLTVRSQPADYISPPRWYRIERARCRGWLEMDLILGDWASKNLIKMDATELRQFEVILDLENPDLFKWITGQVAVPEELDSHLFQELRDYVKAQFSSVPVPRNGDELSSRRWWSEEVTDEMRENAKRRDAEAELAAVKS